MNAHKIWGTSVWLQCKLKFFFQKVWKASPITKVRTFAKKHFVLKLAFFQKSSGNFFYFLHTHLNLLVEWRLKILWPNEFFSGLETTINWKMHENRTFFNFSHKSSGKNCTRHHIATSDSSHHFWSHLKK